MPDAETKPPQPASNNQSVHLGVGTLIIIALIVTTCSGRSEVEKVQKDTAELKQQLRVIETKLDAMVQNGGAITFRNTETRAAPADPGTTPPERP